MPQMIEKYRSILLYLFFGVCTTVINIITYFICARMFVLTTSASTVMAWGAAVIFAYITNKIFVFDSKTWVGKTILRELCTFFICRALTGVLDLAIMLVGVDVMQLYDVGVKIFSNILVILLNYIASKLVIFKKGE